MSADGRDPDRGRRDRGHHADGRDRSARRDRRVCAARAACGSTSTARTGCRRRRAGRARRRSTGLARADSCSRRRAQVAVPAEGVRRRAGAATPTRSSRAFAHEEGYLPHQRHELHAADITLEYSRPFRALKLWLAFRAHGAAQFRDAIERNLRRGRSALPPRADDRGLRGPGGAAAAVDRADPPRAARRRRPRRPQPGARRRDPGRRPRLPRVGADRRRGLAPPVLRELPHDRGGRPGVARRGARVGRATRRGRRRETSRATGSCPPSARSSRSSATCRWTSARCGRSRTCSGAPRRSAGTWRRGSSRRRPALVDRVRGPVGAVGVGRAGGAAIRRGGGDQPTHRDRGAEDPGVAGLGHPAQGSRGRPQRARRADVGGRDDDRAAVPPVQRRGSPRSRTLSPGRAGQLAAMLRSLLRPRRMPTARR